MAVANKYRGTYVVLVLVLIVTFLLSICCGAVDISVTEVLSAFHKVLHNQHNFALNERILLQIRLPRAVLCMLAGGTLAVGGTLLQALFYNPIVEPGLIGTSSGAAFGAALFFVLGYLFKFYIGEWTLPIVAFGGGLLATFLVYILSEAKQSGKRSIVTLLLTGIAINALFLSCTGFLAYIAKDPQARSITFWSMGSLAGANWHFVIVTAITFIPCMIIALRYSKQLNALIMGEEEAMLLGVHVKRLKRTILLINVVMIATITSFTGVISFVGLIVPHLLRMWKGSDNRYLIIGSTLLGAILLSLADIIARVALRPAELPIGIVTSLVGVPVFIFLLRNKSYYF